MYVGRSSGGISCLFRGRRLVTMPTDMASLPLNGVMLVDKKLPIAFSSAGIVRHKHARAALVRLYNLSELGDLALQVYNLTVEATTLDWANRLYDDILTGDVEPKRSYMD